MFKPKPNQFNCFSPPVMLATLIIEFGLAVYTLWRYKLNAVTRLAVLLLIGLGAFQLAEYNVCTGSTHAEAWSRFGFVMITALPALGLHLMSVLAGKPKRRLVLTAYATMAAYMVFFLAYRGTFTGDECTGNYVIFHLADNVSGWFSVYYYGWLAAGIGLGGKWANELMKAGAKARPRLQSVRGMIVGYLIFLVPTGITNTVKPETLSGIPSILCGFAVLLALTLSFYVLPKAATKRHRG
jgi:hypothetical protein